MLYTAKKILFAIADSLRFKKVDNPPKLIMTLLVKNEEQVLEQNILFHKKMGVDAFIITDNNSTDSTPEIIQKYVDKGWIVESIRDCSRFIQKKQVDKMIWSARCNHHADWIINCDGDEFWYSPKGDLKAEMLGKTNILRCKSVSVYPESGLEYWQWNKVIKPMPDTSIYDLSEFNIFRRYTYKVAHKTRGYIKISRGNHKVTMLPSHKQDSDIVVYHYNILNRQSFIDKVIKAGGRPEIRNAQKRTKKGASRHLKYFYEQYKAGKIDQEYDRVVGTKYFEEFQQLGYIERDETMVDIFKKISKK